MSKILFLYSSTDGHTERISRLMMQQFSLTNNKVDLIDCNLMPKINFSDYDKFLLGASIRYGNYNKNIPKFINHNLAEIQKLKNGFFTVNAVERKPDKQTPDTNPYVSKFLRLSSWQPNKIGVFAGKIDYPKYRFFDKHIIKFIMYITGGPTDTSKSYEFTDWDAVKKFTEDFDLL